MSYHRGTVWAVEQATIIFGLRRFGFDARALDLAEALFDLALTYPDYRIPECVGGYARGERPVPGAYPRANTPQLWNATAFPLAVHTMLGLVQVGRATPPGHAAHRLPAAARIVDRHWNRASG
jgi:glycogen debranching enzyme